MTDREALAYIKGLVDYADMDGVIQDAILETINKQLDSSGNITIPYVTTGTDLPSPDWTVTCTDVLGPNYGG